MLCGVCTKIRIHLPILDEIILNDVHIPGRHTDVLSYSGSSLFEIRTEAEETVDDRSRTLRDCRHLILRDVDYNRL